MNRAFGKHRGKSIYLRWAGVAHADSLLSRARHFLEGRRRRIILLSLCWGTKWLAWRCGGIVRPNKTLEPASAAAALAAQGQRRWAGQPAVTVSR